MSRLPLYAVGDPHGHWKQITAQLAHAPPGVVVTLGDHDLVVPFHMTVAPILACGHQVRWIAGNHDLEFGYDLLWNDAAEWDLGGKVTEIGGWKLAGLNGIFRGKVWYPKEGEEVVHVKSRQEFLDRTKRLKQAGEFGDRAVSEIIFLDDVEHLSTLRADVLFTHEAPSVHKHGFVALDRLAADLNVSWHVHGHHHTDYAACMVNGIAVRGLCIGQVWQVPP